MIQLKMLKNDVKNLNKKIHIFIYMLHKLVVGYHMKGYIASNVENAQYSEDQLNTLMKRYKDNKDNKDIVFDDRRNDAIKTSNETTETISDELTNKEDPWLSAKQ